MSRLSPNSHSDPRDAARAIDAIRRGWPIRVETGEISLCLLAIETATGEALAAFAGGETCDLLISGERAETLKIANQRSAAGASAVAIALPENADLAAGLAVADPALDLDRPLKGPFAARDLDQATRSCAEVAIDLARHAGLLPAYFIGPGCDNATLVSPGAVARYADPGALVIAARARLPVAAAHDSEIVAFRSRADAREHLALVIGSPDDTVPLVRLHSECLTGDALGSLKCDCGPQLGEALARIAGASWGVLLYLRQEGRGIGLINKLRAYALQDQGFDTVDANIRLGFPAEARDFAIAAHMLKLLNITAVRLLSNNPQKAERIEAEGITVAERVPHKFGETAHNKGYLSTKKQRAGHQL